MCHTILHLVDSNSQKGPRLSTTCFSGYAPSPLPSFCFKPFLGPPKGQGRGWRIKWAELRTNRHFFQVVDRHICICVISGRLRPTARRTRLCEHPCRAAPGTAHTLPPQRGWEGCAFWANRPQGEGKSYGHSCSPLTPATGRWRAKIRSTERDNNFRGCDSTISAAFDGALGRAKGASSTAVLYPVLSEDGSDGLLKGWW